ncbi:MAG: hypothetical protein SFU56_09250, partial [Capsulimonadales bacterium]|nr:hypothetical protein [Capsulimonadales bacterium]
MKRPFEVRLYRAGSNTAYRVLPLKLVGPSVYRVGREGYYLDATLTLKGRLSDSPLSGIVSDARVGFFGQGVDGNPVECYIGYVRDIQEVKIGVRKVVLTLYGLYERISRIPVRQRFAFPSADEEGVDLSVAASRIWNAWAKRYYPDLLVSTSTVGQTVDYVDGFRRTIGDINGDLMRLAGGLMAFGCDTDSATGQDRLFIRAYGDPNAPDHVWSLPSPPDAPFQVIAKRSGKDSRRIVNVLDVVGGQPQYPNLMTRGAGFEYPTLTGTVTNLITDPGFEAAGAGPWTLGGGASEKLASEGVEGQTDGGNTMVELDNDGEYVQQVVDSPAVALVPGAMYTAEVRARLESGTHLSYVDATLTWRNAGGSVGTLTQRIAPTSADFATFRISGPCPTGADRFTFRTEMPTGGDAGDGVMVDNVAVYNSEAVSAEGMEVRVNGGNLTGSAQVNSIDWAYPDGHSGAYCLAFDVVSTDADNNDVSIREFQGRPIPVTPRGNYRLTAWVKNFPGEISYPAIQLQILKLNNGEYKNIGVVNFASGNYPDWTPLILEGVPGDIAFDQNQAIPAFVIRGTGKGLMDSLLFTASAAPKVGGVPVYYEGPFEATYRADERFGSGPIHDSNADYGDLPELVTNDSIQTHEDGGRLADATFTARAREVRNPDVEIVGAALPIRPGQYVRGIGSESGAILPEPLPIVEIEGRYDGGKLTQAVYFATERPDDVRTQIRLAREAAKRSQYSGSIAAGALSGGGNGGFVDARATEVQAARTRDANAPWLAATFATLKAHFAAIWKLLRTSATNASGAYASTARIGKYVRVINGADSYGGTYTGTYAPTDGIRFAATNSIEPTINVTTDGVLEVSLTNVWYQSHPPETANKTLAADEWAQFDTSIGPLYATLPSAGFV